MSRFLFAAPACLGTLIVLSCAPASHKASPTRPGPTQRPPAKKESAATVKRKALPRKEQGKVTSISLTEAFALQQSGDVLIYDARPSFYFMMGHIPSAKSMPKASCEEEIQARKAELAAATAAKKPIIVYCTNLLCADARKVATHLSENGYSSSVLSGGWDSWKESGLPTE